MKHCTACGVTSSAGGQGSMTASNAITALREVSERNDDARGLVEAAKMWMDQVNLSTYQFGKQGAIPGDDAMAALIEIKACIDLAIDAQKKHQGA